MIWCYERPDPPLPLPCAPPLKTPHPSAAPPAFATTPAASPLPPLNSERIARRYGSYGVEILQQTADLRLSSLYSEHRGQRTARTLALTRFLPAAPPLADTQQKIRAGGSIGALLKNAGWHPHKLTLRTENPSSRRFNQTVQHHMRLTPHPQPLALRLYLLRLSKHSPAHQIASQTATGPSPDHALDYALIAELYHPDYLNTAELKTPTTTSTPPTPYQPQANHLHTTLFTLLGTPRTDTIECL